MTSDDARPEIDLGPLVAAAAAVTVLVVADVVPVWAGAPHHVALPPLDLFADVRVLLAESPSYPAFVASLGAVMALRVVVMAAMLRSMDRAGLVRAARFYGAALPVALVSGGLAFAGVSAVYSLFLWAGVVVALAAVLTVGPRPWRRAAAPVRALGPVGAYVGALLAVSLLSALGGTAARLLLVWASAALTGAVVRRIGRGRPRGRARSGVVGLALVLGALGTVPVASTGEAPTVRPTPGTLLVVPGIGGSSGTSTMFRLDPARLGFDCDRTVYFSYAGPGDGAPQRDARCPIRRGAPYQAEDTRRPLAELTTSFRAQLADLDPPVTVVAHSQGAWVAAAALDGGDAGAAPAAVVVLGGFPGHRGAYRLDGSGAGVVGTDLLEALSAGLRAVGGTTFDPRAPLQRQLLGTEGAIADLMRRGFGPGVQVVSVTSALDLPIMAGDRRHQGVVDLCPVYVHHGSLPRSTHVLVQIREALHGSRAGGCGWWRRWPAQAFTAFAVPDP